MVYTFNLHHFVCQFYLNKTGKKVSKGRHHTSWQLLERACQGALTFPSPTNYALLGPSGRSFQGPHGKGPVKGAGVLIPSIPNHLPAVE